jgi:hypothetical protein
MTDHVTPGLPPIPCLRESHGHCAICERIDRNGPNYSEPYRRLFHPEEFSEEPPAVMAAPEPTLQPAVPCPEAGPQPAPMSAEWLAQVPLAGDLVAALTKRMGIDWVVKTVADELGVDCGCPERQQKLNALDAKFRRFLGW